MKTEFENLIEEVLRMINYTPLVEGLLTDYFSSFGIVDFGRYWDYLLRNRFLDEFLSPGVYNNPKEEII